MSMIRAQPTRVDVIQTKVVYVVDVVRIDKHKVILRVGGKEYEMREGDTFEFSLNVD